MIVLPDHLIIAPILVPLFAGALMLLYDLPQRRVIAVLSGATQLYVAWLLVQEASTGSGTIGVYLLGNWPPPFAIVLVLDRLSAMMVLLTAILALPSTVFAMARWDRRGQHYHSLFQFLLMGVNGAFLTGDLFNLFVFFEVLLAASYGLALHGSGLMRVRAGMHYIAINLAASLLFLIGVSLIYGVTGTLNMADLAAKVPLLAADDRPILAAGAAILGIAFLVKAAMWPLGFWLPMTYMAAAPSAAAMFAILSKVGVYVLMRVTSLAFGASALHLSGLGAEVLVAGGFATLVFGTLGVLASQGLARLAGCTVLVSSGTLLAVTGMAALGGGSAIMAGALYYTIASTLAISALFLMVELIEREQGALAGILTVTAEAYGFGDEELDEDDLREDLGPGVAGATSALGICFFLCALVLAGMPPLAGFLGKFAMLSAALGSGTLAAGDISGVALAFTGLVIVSGLAALIALVREGIRTFWASEREELPAVPFLELAPVIVLLALTVLVSVRAEPVMRYMEATASMLGHPHVYVRGVLGDDPTRGIPPPSALTPPAGPQDAIDSAPRSGVFLPDVPAGPTQ